MINHYSINLLAISLSAHSCIRGCVISFVFLVPSAFSSASSQFPVNFGENGILSKKTSK